MTTAPQNPVPIPAAPTIDVQAELQQFMQQLPASLLPFAAKYGPWVIQQSAANIGQWFALLKTDWKAAYQQMLQGLSAAGGGTAAGDQPILDELKNIDLSGAADLAATDTQRQGWENVALGILFGVAQLIFAKFGVNL